MNQMETAPVPSEEKVNLLFFPSSPEFLLSCFGALDQKEMDIQKIADMYINDIHGLVIRLLIGRQHSLGKDRTKE